MTTSKALQDREDRGLRMAAAGVAALGMLFVGFFYVASGLVAPAWAIVALWIVWLALAWYGFRLAGIALVRGGLVDPQAGVCSPNSRPQPAMTTATVNGVAGRPSRPRR